MPVTINGSQSSKGEHGNFVSWGLGDARLDDGLGFSHIVGGRMQVPIGNMVVRIDFNGADEALPCFGKTCLVIQQIAVIVICGCKFGI